jgi:hypothetical protein
VSQAKPFVISKQLVWEAYKRVKANQGAAGVDSESVERSRAISRTISTRYGIACHRARTFPHLSER